MKKMLTIGAAMFGLGAATSAMAQMGTADITPTNINVRLGIGLPLDNELSNFGNPLLALGAEYQFSQSLFPNGATYFSLDYMTNGTRFDREIIPICINQRFYFGGLSGHRTYGFFGVGAAILDIDNANTVIAARGGIGADVGEAIFFEAAATITDKADGLTGDNVAFYVGYRF